MVVLYKNFFNESISEIQALKMNGYKKEFHDNKVVKKIENKYANGNFHVTYYKDNNESNVLENLSKEYPPRWRERPAREPDRADIFPQR